MTVLSCTPHWGDPDELDQYMTASSPASQHSLGQHAQIRLLFLGYYMALGAFMPFINLYYERRGFSGLQIGILSALVLAASSATSIPWGAVADKFHLHHRILTISMLLAPVFVFLLSRASGFVAMIPVVIGYALVIAPIVPILDGCALEAAKTDGRTYGEMRVGGTLGWIISVWLVGVLIQRLGIHWLFYAYIIFMVLALILALSRPLQSGSTSIPLRRNLRSLLADPVVLFFLLSIFLAAVGSGALLNFFSLYMDGIGANEGIIGFSWALAALSEIPVMLYAGALIRRIGSATLLKIAFGLYAVRALLLSFITTPAWALAVQLLQGLAFAAFLNAGVTYLNQRTPPGLSTTAQAVYNVVTYGLASMVGALLGGYLYDTVGIPVMLRVLSLVTLVGLALFWLTAPSERISYAANA
jgi:PPP family 3-phenylpropionic acid transporter